MKLLKLLHKNVSKLLKLHQNKLILLLPVFVFLIILGIQRSIEEFTNAEEVDYYKLTVKPATDVTILMQLDFIGKSGNNGIITDLSGPPGAFPHTKIDNLRTFGSKGYTTRGTEDIIINFTLPAGDVLSKVVITNAGEHHSAGFRYTNSNYNSRFILEHNGTELFNFKPSEDVTNKDQILYNIWIPQNTSARSNFKNALIDMLKFKSGWKSYTLYGVFAVIIMGMIFGAKTFGAKTVVARQPQFMQQMF